MASTRVLLTGACGFLGRAVAARLRQAGHEVIGLDRIPRAGEGGFRHVVDDLSDAVRLSAIVVESAPTHVIHAGGVSGPMVMPDRAMEIMAVNVGSSLNLLRACLDHGVRTLVHCSSVAALGSFHASRPIPEDHPMRPENPYACSKAAVEMVLRGLWGRVPLDLCALRFTAIYGPGRRTSFIIDEIVAAGLAGKPATITAIGAWPYIYIDDAADAVVAACFSTHRRQLAYYVAYPEQVSVADIVAATAAALDVPHVAVAAEGTPTERGPLDLEPSRRDFGFAPRVDHREGIRRMVEAQRAANG